MHTRIIAFYTPAYREVVARLIDSIEQTAIPARVVAMDDAGGWIKNVGQKPAFVYDMLRDYPDEQLLYVDADAIVRSDPRPLMPGPSDCDIGLHYRRRPGLPDTDEGECLSGTMLLNPTPATLALVTEWMHHQTARPDLWDQVTLATAVRQHVAERGLRLHHLPASMTFIFDTMRRDHPDVVPVIEHFQHSRTIKAAEREARREQ